MKLGDIGFFQLASQRLTYLAGGQQAIAQNVANADTPGYRSVTTQSFESYLTDARADMHDTMTPRDVEIVERQDAWEASQNGNSVSLAQEALQAASIQGQHTLAKNLIGKAHTMIALAASKP